MHPGIKKLLEATLVASALLAVILGPGRSLGDEPSRLGRLFRFGSGPSASAPPPPASAPEGPIARNVGAGVPTSSPTPSPYPLTGAPANTPVDAASAPRIMPKPRESRPVTEADPLVTRIWLVQSNDGTRFGMFMQVFADGTVLDNSGVHHLGREAIKPLIDTLQANELYRQKGHCGSPATDFVEQVHVVIYERSLGRLRAHAFSHSGNTQGCDHAVHHLNAVFEALQAKISAPPISGPAAAPGLNSTTPPVNGAPVPPTTANTIPLTPSN